MRPKRTDDKYWTGTRNFNHIQYESDLEDYIIDLENENQQLRKNAVVGSAIEIPDFVSEDQWWCPECNMIVEPECVTYEQTHDERCGGCGFMVW